MAEDATIATPQGLVEAMDLAYLNEAKASVEEEVCYAFVPKDIP